MEGEELAMPSSVVHSLDNPESLYEKKMIQQFIQKGLLKLNNILEGTSCSEVFQGFSYEEIGRLFQLSEGTVKSKLHRARMNLKEILERSTH